MASSMNAAAAAATTATTTTTTMHSDHNGNARRSSSPRKEKTILGWLVKSASVSNDNANANDNDNNNRSTNEQNTNCNCESRAFRDFRGVQTLRLLWSKRISNASEEAAAHQQQQQQHHSSHSGLGTLRKLNKSVSCLVNAFNNARDWPTTPTNAPETRSKRAASLHNLQEVQLQQQQQHKCKDNFYKYKNAEQAKMAAATTTSATNATFAAIKASDGERFLQWPKREDVVIAASKSKADKQREREKVGENVLERVGEREKELQAPLISAQPAAALTSPRVSLSATSAHGGSSESLQTLNSISSSRTTSSATTTTTTTTGRATRRKYSFKTHAGKSFHQHHTPRRMSSHASSSSSHLHTHNVVGVAADIGEQRAEGVSLVRQLTQQFNEIIQKDARLLEQVKRKNGVWLSRGSHVYKIVEKPSTEGGGSSTVQSNIKKFEKLEKPAVPKKPVQLRHNTLSLNKQMRNRRRGLQLGKLQLEKQQEQVEQQQQQQQQEKDQRVELEVLPELSTDEGVQSDVDDAIKPKPQTLSSTAATAASATALTQYRADDDADTS